MSRSKGCYPGKANGNRGFRRARSAFRPAVTLLEDRSVPAAVAGAGTGLVGNYFADTGLADLRAARVDPAINFSWAAAPASGVPADGFSARWTGLVQAQFTEAYTFTVTADEGTRLTVNGQQLVDKWSATSPGVYSGTVSLTAGELYDLNLEAEDATGPAQVKLEWASLSTPKQVVPASQLYATGGWLDTDLGSPAVAGSLRSTGTAYTVSGSGVGTATADQGNFAYQRLDGDGSVVAQVGSVSGTANAGLMVRDGLAANGLFAAVTATATGTRFDFRSAADGASASAGSSPTTGPVWLKLRRDGDVFFGYTSPTGADDSWTLVGDATVPMAGSANAGLFVNSGSATTAKAVDFTNVAVSQTTPIGANLDAITDYNVSKVFVDAFKQARAPISQTPGVAGYPAKVDADGWPTEDAEYFIQSGALGQAHNFNGTYHLSFTGHADLYLGVTPGTVSNQVYDAATNTTTADITLNASDSDAGWYLQLYFFNTNGGVKNIKLIRPGYDPDTTQVFTNEFLAAVQPFQTLRFMDWLRTNANPVANWSDRAKVTDATQSTDKGVAWDYIAELANVTGKDIWINVPLHATDDYVRSLAQFLHANLTPGHVVYLEYSNEVWNTLFLQGRDNIQLAVQEVEAGMASGTPSDLYYPGEDAKRWDGTWENDYTWAMRRVARELKDIVGIFASVYGQDQVNETIRGVMANQIVNPYIARNVQLAFLQDRYGPPSNYVYAIGYTTFFNTWEHETGTLTPDQVLQYLGESIQELTAYYPMYTQLALQFGLRSFATEGGNDTYGSTNNVEEKAAANNDPRMQALVEQFLTTWFQAGGSHFNWFVAGATNYFDGHGTWGLTGDIGDLNSPKFLGVEQVLDSPPPAVTLGTMIPSSIPANSYYSSPDTVSPYMGLIADGTSLNYLVRVPAGGQYALVLDYANTAADSVDVYLNGVKVGTVTLAKTGSDTQNGAAFDFANSKLLLLNLDPGLSNVEFRFHGSGASLRSVKFLTPAEAATLPPPPVPLPPPPPVPLPPPPVPLPPPVVNTVPPVSPSPPPVVSPPPATRPTSPPAVPPASPPVAAPIVTPSYAIAAGAGGAPTVRVFGADGSLRFAFDAYEKTFTGGVRVAMADVSGDGTPEVVVAPGAGRAPEVRILDGSTGGVMAKFLAFEPSFVGGVNLAVGDLTGDGVPDIIVAADTTGGPRVRVFDGKSFTVLADFWGIDDPAFRGGVRVAVGDVNGDGRADLVVAAGIGGGPRVSIYDGRSVAGGTPTRLVNDFFAFEPGLRNGANVAVGDVNGDGRADLILGGGPGGAPRVLVLDGSVGMAGGFNPGNAAGVLANFFAGNVANRDGVRVAVSPSAGAKTFNVVTAVDDGEVRVYVPSTLQNHATDPTPLRTFHPFDEVFVGGVFVG